MPDHCDNLKDDVPECLKRGHKLITPGIYECADGHEHVNGPELCEVLGLEPTPENLYRIFRMMEKRFGDVRVIG